jgi:hypothetical protein
MGNQEAARNVTPPPPVSPPFVTTTLQASHPSRVKPGLPSHFDGDRVHGRAFLTSCELYISLTQSDFVVYQVRIHWALSYYKGGCTVSFTERILHQELRSGKMCFASWREFAEEFALTFCPENDDTPLAPSPCVDRSRPKCSDVYRSSTQNADATTLRTPKVDDILLSILTIATPRDRSLSHL